MEEDERKKWGRIKKKLKILMKEIKKQGKLLQAQEIRILRLEGPSKFYKVGNDGQFIP